MTKIRRDSRDLTIRKLQSVLNEALEHSLSAQLCARGNDLATARRQAQARDTPEYRKLISPDGNSGYLAFQWISQSLLETVSHISKVDLQSFWLLAEAGKDTKNVYETNLKAALKPLNEEVSAVRKNLNELFEQYPQNKIGVDSLALLKQLSESVDVIERSIGRLLLLSPPAKASFRTKITWKLVALVFLVALLTLPIFYWLAAGGLNTDVTAVSNKAAADLTAVKDTARDAPSALPGLIFKDVIPATSNLLLLLSALLGVARAFSRDARSDSKKMIEELTTAANKLREIKAE